jgi:N-acyl-D-aspartate/D-glutamate deacylase
MHDLLIRNAVVLDGHDRPGRPLDVAIAAGRIQKLGDLATEPAREVRDGSGLVLAPGFIDVHTHDDSMVIRRPQQLPKLSQGVTTVVVGNCGISAAPVRLRGEPPDPLNLLGPAAAFVYPTFAAYRTAVEQARPGVNVAALVGHTALRSNHLDDLYRAATPAEIAAMRAELRESLAAGALGLSSGLAYASAAAAPTDEVAQLAAELDAVGGLYATHLRSEFAAVHEALDEALDIGRQARAPVVVSHFKCAGVDNWGRAPELLGALAEAAQTQQVGCDCYPYAASSSTLDLKQVTHRHRITITWSTPHPECSGHDLDAIAADWGLDLDSAARRLQPAGAVYYGMSEADVHLILAHPLSMIGSDGLPEDPFPHPRLWGAFPRVLGHFSRDLGLFPLHTAVYKMTGLSAARFGLEGRGLIEPGAHADLVLFDPARIRDVADFSEPQRPAEGIHAVWVNGRLAYAPGQSIDERHGRFLPRTGDLRQTFPRC